MKVKVKVVQIEGEKVRILKPPSAEKVVQHRCYHRMLEVEASSNLACGAAVDDASPTGGPRQRPKAGQCTETRGPPTSSKRKGQTQSTTNGMAFGGKATQKKKRADVAKQAPVIPTPSTPCMPTLHR